MGKPLPFPIHFDAIMFFAEFQFRNLVVWSPYSGLGRRAFGFASSSQLVKSP
jgi:hypothetical protein